MNGSAPVMKKEYIDTDTLVDDYAKLVYHLIHRIVHDVAVHDDLFQEVFLRILGSIDRFEGRSKLSTWIASVTVRTCYHYVGSRMRRATQYSFERFLEEGGDIADGIDTDPGSIDTARRTDRITRAIDRLPMKYRLPIILFYFEEYRYREIAAALDMPIGSVKTNLYRGLRALKEELKHEREELL
jgi:RNA polymerase sigma factor (sigma-70 family)